MQLHTFLRGPHPALPRPLDLTLESWARLQPRVRTAVVVVLAVVVVAAVAARVRAAEHRWGGAPRPVLTATRDLPVGPLPHDSLRRVLLPPDAVPPDAVDRAPAEGVLALALPAGSVLTSAHLDVRGPAAGLAPGLRAVPVDVDPGWGVTAGGWVDVWVLAGGAQPSTLVAGPCPVLAVRTDNGRSTALVGLAGDEVAIVSTGIAVGGVLLTHAPPPGTATPSGYPPSP